MVEKKLLSKREKYQAVKTSWDLGRRKVILRLQGSMCHRGLFLFGIIGSCV